MYKTYFKYKNLKKFGVPVEQIEGFEEAITSPENYVVHHVLEWKYSTKELIEMNRYDNVIADELMFVPASVHSSSLYIHKDKINSINAFKNLSKEQRAENQRKAAKANIGKTRSKETKDKMSKSKLNFYTENPDAKLKCGNSTRGKHWETINGKRTYLEV